MGFLNATIYRIVRSTSYHRAFHDVTAGNNTVRFPPKRITGYHAAPAGIQSADGAVPTQACSFRYLLASFPRGSQAQMNFKRRSGRQSLVNGEAGTFLFLGREIDYNGDSQDVSVQLVGGT